MVICGGADSKQTLCKEKNKTIILIIFTNINRLFDKEKIYHPLSVFI